MAVTGLVDRKTADSGEQAARRVLSILSRHRSSLFDRFGLDRLAVFGSTVRGDHRKGSDIDILVRFRQDKIKDFDSGLSDYYGVLSEIKEVLSSVLNRKRIDVSDERTLFPQYRASILEEAMDVPAAGGPFVFEKRGPMEKTVKKYFEDMKEACQYIEEDLRGQSLEDYLKNRPLRQTVERNLEIIGEAVNKASKIDPAVRENLPEAGKLIGLRNRLIHGYDSIIHPQIFHSVKDLLPGLEQKVQEQICILEAKDPARKEQ